MQNKKKVLILCTANPSRSQMAEALLKHICQNQYDTNSAGTRANIVRPEAIEVLKELAIDISNYRSKSVDKFAAEKIDYVLTVCDNAKEHCPFFSAETKLTHKSFDDPAAIKGDEKARLDAFRRVRDEINLFISDEYLKIIGWKNGIVNSIYFLTLRQFRMPKLPSHFVKTPSRRNAFR